MRSGGDLTLRKALRAPAGKVVVAADSSQIEARVLAYLADNHALLDAFRAKCDIYSEFAVTIFGGDADEIAKGAAEGREPFKFQRQVAKSAVLGAGFGMGPAAFVAYCWTNGKVRISDEMARQVIGNYREVNAPVVLLWRRAEQILELLYQGESSGEFCHGIKYGPLEKFHPLAGSIAKCPAIILPDMFPICYHGLSRVPSARGFEYSFTHNKKPKKIYGGKVIENVVQAYAFAIMRWQAVEMFNRTGVRPAINVHDEWVFVVDRDRADSVKDALIDVMRTPPPWAPGLPLNCSAGIAENYGEI
jgi:DNA polymerase I - 3'-5' exonuclease and polymerase domains